MSRFLWGDTPLKYERSWPEADPNTAIAAPGEGYRIWITDIQINGEDSSNTVELKENDDSGDIILPAFHTFSGPLNAPIKLEPNVGVYPSKSGSGTNAIFIGYYITRSDEN